MIDTMDTINRAWKWLCKGWWIVIAILGLALYWLIGRSRTRDESWRGWRDEYNEFRDETKRTASERIIDLQREHRKRLEEIEAKHRAQLNALTEEQKERYAEYKDDPNRLANWLIDLANGK